MKSKAAIGRLTVLGSLLSLGIVFFCLATDMNARDPSPQTSLLIKPQNPLADDDLALTHWITSDGYQPMPFAEWQAQQPPPSPLHIEVIYSSTDMPAGGPADHTICALVNPAGYDGIATALARWVTDLENEGWQMIVFRASFPDQQALRSHLAGIDGLEGCILIGDFPVPWYELDSKQFPFDVYYMDLNGTWIDSDLDGLYDDHTGDVAPEIWIGRLLASNLDFSGDEVSLLNNYFAKNHAYRTRLLALPSRALVYLDDDWEYAAQNMGQQTAILYSDTTVVSDPNTTRAGDYARRLTDYYAWVHVFAHSTTSGHNFTINDGTTRDAIYNDDIRQIDPHTFFYNLFACGAARFVERNYLSGWYVFADTYGLLTIGSTTTGGMVRGYGLFFGFLAAGLPLGQAFRDWFAVEGVIDRGWHYGLTLHGDPTLVVNTEEQVSEPPTSVTITGPTTGDVRSPNIFTATVDPITATQPFEYVWTATDQLTVTHKSGLSDTIALNWRNTHGVKFITLTVTNFAGTVTGSHIITVAAPEMEIAPHSFHKTLVQGEWLTRSLTISNTGQGSLAFELFEADPGSSPGHDPDPFGYAYKDSAMAGGPIYQWIEIAPPAGGSGTQANLPTTWEGGYTWPIPLPFAFEFYGGVYTDVAINSHGTLSFRDRHIGRINVPIPSVRSFGDEILIAHFWDFLVIDPGAVYYQALDSMFIVEYYQVSRYGGSDHGTWEIILFDTGNILFQYQDVDFAYYWGNNGQSATVGIQGDAITGLQYSYDTPKLSNGLAICFAHPGQLQDCTRYVDTPWLSKDPSNGRVKTDGVLSTDLVLDTRVPDVKEPGTYGSTLVIVSNDPDKSLLMVPISMTVSSPIYGLALAPSADAQTANPGSTVTYTLRLTNTGNIIDNFSVTLSEYNWPTIASVTAGPLPPSYDTNIGVIVQVPPDAPEGASDTATVVIYSQGDNGQSVSAALTTTALAAPSDSHVLLLPLIMKQ